MASNGIPHMVDLINRIDVSIVDFLSLTCGIHQTASIMFTLLKRRRHAGAKLRVVHTRKIHFGGVVIY